MYVVFDTSKHNDLAASIIGATDSVEEIIKYVREDAGIEDKNELEIIRIGINQLENNEAYLIEIPDSDDFVIIIKVRKGLV